MDTLTVTQKARATGRYIRTSPSKVRRILDQIKGKTYQDAVLILEFTPYKASEIVLNIIQSAASNAEHNYGMARKDLKVAAAYADRGPVIKRLRPRAQGRGYPIRKHTSHITIELAV